LVTSGGQNLRYRPSIKKINNTSLYGDTLIDGIYRGLSGVQLLVTFKEWTSTIRSLLWPWSTNLGEQGRIGQLASALAAPIVLTAQALSPAAVNGPATLTASLALLAPENDVSVLFGPDERDIPVLFDLYLYDDSGTKVFFKLT
jgi:hypothetical protein